MQIDASLITGKIASTPISQYGQKLAARIETGQRFELADGGQGRILRKSASADGVRLHASIGGTVRVLSAEQFSDLAPVSPAMRRLAGFLHRIYAFNAEIDMYVKTAIREAGLPVDPKINWAKYLYRMYGPALSKITKDPEVFSDAIIEVIVQELYHKKLLSADSAYAHFDPNHEALAGKELANKVTAFLVNIFKGRKELVCEHARRMLGVGMRGEFGLMSTESLNSSHQDDEGNDATDHFAPGVENEDIADFDSRDEVESFLNAFASDVIKHQRKAMRPILHAITREYIKGTEYHDVKQHVMESPQLEKELGKKINRDAYNYALSLWARLVEVYAKDPNNRWSKTPIAKLIAAKAKKLEESLAAEAGAAKGTAGKAPKHSLRLASALRLAEYVENGEEEQAANPAPATPPPPSPNMQQQLAVTAPQQGAAKSPNGLNLAQPGNDADPNDDGMAAQPNQQMKKTVAPEIPGVNHTAASTEKIMPAAKKTTPILARVPEKKAAPAVEAPVKSAVAAPVKYAALRTIARKEPHELGAALTQLHASFSGITGKLAAVIDNLDLNHPAPKAGSGVREKIAHRARYAKALRRVAEENPEQVDEVVNDLYAGLDEIVTELENLADNLDITLVDPVAEDDDFTEEPVTEEGNPSFIDKNAGVKHARKMGRRSLTVQDARDLVFNSGFELEPPANDDDLAEFIFRNQEMLIPDDTHITHYNITRAVSAYLSSIGVNPSDYISDR